MKLEVHTGNGTYPIIIEHGVLRRAFELIPQEGRKFLISDDGVPEKWRNILKEQYPNSTMYVLPQGEGSKSFEHYQKILEAMLAEHLSRKDMVIALGGGVVGDLSGFAAATYMRGIRYVNIPTTSLSQIDSSIGGKTAIDLAGIKNCVGAFHQPVMVLVDPETLQTLTPRHLHNGLAEAVKEGLIQDPELFALFEREDYMEHLDEIIERSLKIKRDVVEHDEKETGERKLLNFGHTYGHAYESYYGLQGYYHGECVAMGMMTILKDEDIKNRLGKVLDRLQLPKSCDADKEAIVELIKSDKKAEQGGVTVAQVHAIGNGTLEYWNMEEIRKGIGL